MTPQPDYDRLRRAIAGEVLEPASAGYDTARAMWNGAVDRHPAAILRCTATADVAAAVRFATDAQLPLTVRGGGHGFSGLAIADDSLLIDTSPMKRITVDRERSRAFAQPGVLGGELDRATQAHALATTLGTISHTGIAGLTLGGGWGWLMRQYGLTCDNLISAEVVLADGQTVRASEVAHPDLFWALRGGGGQFGAVTEYEYALHPLDPYVTVSQWVFAPDAGCRPLLTARDIAADPDRARDMFITSMCLPDSPQLPEHLRGARAYVILCMSTNTSDRDGAWMAPLAQHRPLAAVTGPRPYVDLQAIADLQNPYGLLAHCKGAFITELTDQALMTFVEQAEQLQGTSLMYLHQMGGAVGDVRDGETPLQCRSADYALNIVARWEDPEGEATARMFAGQAAAAFDRFGMDTVPLNFEGDPVGLESRIYGSSLPRLKEIKAKLDPHDVFGGAHPAVPEARVAAIADVRPGPSAVGV